MAPVNPPELAGPKKTGLLLLAIAYLGFISLGLPDPAAGVAWPGVRETFSLPQSGFGLIFIGLGCGYCLSGFFGGKLTLFLGLGNLLWISSGLVAIAMFGSGLAPVWPVFVACAAIWGLGSGGIDAGLNAYASNHFSARHVNWLHACYSLGATLGPLLMTAVLLQTGSWRNGYALVGGALLLMSGLFFVTRERWSEPPKPAATHDDKPASLRAALRNLLVWLQVALFFLYVGLEFTVGQWSFTLLTESRHVGAAPAGMLVGGYYGSIGVGRVLAGFVAHRMGLDRLLRISMLVVLAGTVVFAFESLGRFSSAGLFVIGLGLAPVFPTTMARTPQRLREHAIHAVGFQVSAGMLGAALMPGLAGLLVERMTLEVVTWFAVALAVLLFATHEIILGVGRRHRSTGPVPVDGTTD